MKKHITYLMLTAIVVFSACKKDSIPKEYDLGIDLQSYFDHDKVEVLIDGHSEYNNQITTNLILGLAGSTTTSRMAGNHVIKIVVNDNIQKTAVIPLNANLYLGIGYQAQNHSISINYSNHPFAYN